MNALKFFIGYIKHFLSAISIHNIHSPFVFQILTGMQLSDEDSDRIANIEKLRKGLLRDNSEIIFFEMGAGSKISSADQKESGKPGIKRMMRDIIKSSVKPELGVILYKLCRYFKPEVVVELGTSAGISTAFLAMADPGGKIFTIENNPSSADAAEKNFRELGISNIEQIRGTFDNELPSLLGKLRKIDFIFIDGNHRKDPLLKYFELCLEKSHPSTVFIFDDIRWSDDMLSGWESVRNHERVSVTLDLFQAGIAFLVTGIAKQHYRLRGI
ncbi:MAG: class I SAM-dependent methyltransferase [Bacteroidetes bacterium]|nr:class I SAM-dependent methyltransferase [Bacteroidota bacterium]